ncbi:5'/3'-nucleotidase SurE [Candidatus Vallotia tarda]|uniref:5'/3'-nucleotidase SurE n=1 Tax=Candidatus Vallotiella hemipterorum TaxID=1177213 RepID=UPI001C1F7647
MLVFTDENGFYYVSNTPADFIHVAFTYQLNNRPDIVISCMNNSLNMDRYMLYTGTVSAASDGFFPVFIDRMLTS